MPVVRPCWSVARHPQRAAGELSPAQTHDIMHHCQFISPVMAVDTLRRVNILPVLVHHLYHCHGTAAPHPHPPPAGYALPTCHAASDGLQAIPVVAPRGAGFQPACRYHLHRRQVLAVAASAQTGRLHHRLIHRLPPLLPSVSRS